MFERDIEEQEVQDVVLNGKVITSYENDKPYPSFLSLAFVNNRALHVVYAKDENKTVIVITVYEPDSKIWSSNFEIKKDC
ncbi:MAG: DUF4258 domain-containing protein [Helicobacteraceae bacterium]|nr:DUF4258 domain-containing protein [Helicobacteraceae bacterium]